MREDRPGWLRRSVNSLLAFLVCAVLLYAAIFRDHTALVELWQAAPVQDLVLPARTFWAERGQAISEWRAGWRLDEGEPGEALPRTPFPFPQRRPAADLAAGTPAEIAAILRAGYPDSLCGQPFDQVIERHHARTGEQVIAIIRARAPGYPDRHILRHPDTGSWVMFDHFATTDEACQADFGAVMDLLR